MGGGISRAGMKLEQGTTRDKDADGLAPGIGARKVMTELEQSGGGGQVKH